MKNLIITAISALVLLGSGLSYAQDNGPERWKANHHKQHGMRSMPIAKRVFHSFKQLDLNETQKADLKEIFAAMRADLQPVMKEMRAGQKQMRELIKSGNMDDEVIGAIAQKEGKLTTDRIMITSRAMSEAFKLLTSEQRAELQAMASERGERRAERRQKGKLEG